MELRSSILAFDLIRPSECKAQLGKDVGSKFVGLEGPGTMLKEIGNTWEFNLGNLLITARKLPSNGKGNCSARKE
ncbi:hypothetical protein A4A49_19257 [Nicotiana attenuata]|uniref:Uncharacterized protein n=1 Tax=Nicotiana attenuata TaxID=49451 RepID=A0A1J6IIK9_NICAT|nr:hypothetical protein A4A49_19257 [Nicotiana attenuata]